MKFQCPECETDTSVMKITEESHVCQECDHSLTLDEANKAFDEGLLVGLIEDHEVEDYMTEAKKAAKEEDEEEIEEEDDDDEDMKKMKKETADKKKMKKETADKKKMKEEEDEDDEDEDDEKEVEMKKEAAKKKMKEEVEKMVNELEIDIAEDVAAMFKGEELSEDFKTKVTTIFESAIKSKIKVIAHKLEEQKVESIADITESNNKASEIKINKYLDYVIKEWVEDNEVVLEANSRVEMTDKFMDGLSSLFKEHYVEVPEGRYDVLEGLVKEVADLKEKLDTEMEKNIEQTNEAQESKIASIVAECSVKLADTEKEKLQGLIENVEFADEEQYRGKIETLIENYFDKDKVVLNESVDHELEEGAGSEASGDDMISQATAMLKVVK